MSKMRDFVGTDFSDKFFTMRITMIIGILVLGVVAPQLLEGFIAGEQDIQRDLIRAEIEAYIDQGLGGSPYQTEKLTTLIVGNVNVSGTMYYYTASGETGKLSTSGTNARTIIQNAINALASGGKLFIKDGLYEGYWDIANTDNFILEGESWNTTLRMPNGTENQNLIKISDSSHIQIHGLTLDGNSIDNDYLGVWTLQNNIWIEGVGSEILIDDCRIIYSVKNGIETVPGYNGDDLRNIIISNCFFYRCGVGEGFNGVTMGSWGEYSGTIVTDSTFRECELGISIFDGTGITVTDCIVEGGINGIVIEGNPGGGNEAYVTVSGCVIRNNSYRGLYILPYFTGDSSIIVDSCLIYNNTHTGPSRAGVHIGASGTGAARLTLSNCHIWNNGENTTDTANILIQTSGIKDILITGCRIHQSQYTAGNYPRNIMVWGTAGEIKIDGNVIYNTNGRAAITLLNQNRTIIENNRIFDDRTPKRQTLAIEESGTANNNTIINNDVRDWGTAGAAITIAASDTIVRGNIGYVTENWGITSGLANGGVIPHGLAGAPTNTACTVQLTLMNITYDGVKVHLGWDEVNTDSTNISVDLEWANCTSITDSAIAVAWYAYYDPVP